MKWLITYSERYRHGRGGSITTVTLETDESPVELFRRLNQEAWQIERPPASFFSIDFAMRIDEPSPREVIAIVQEAVAETNAWFHQDCNPNVRQWTTQFMKALRDLVGKP